jgi:hypothetical protein
MQFLLNVMADWSALQLHIWEAVGLNLWPQIGYPVSFSKFISVPPQHMPVQ